MVEPDNTLPPGLAKRYEIEKVLGEGGMGHVYLARDKELPRKVAIKTIRSELASDPNIRKRIERECRYHAQIGAHPHIVTLFDKVEEDDQIHLIMEYVPGETLAQVTERFKKKGETLPVAEALSIISQATKALSHIHAHGIVHRDIKPDNLLTYIDESDRFFVKLMDFGIARLESQEQDNTTMLTQAGWTGPGTPAYMAPEQIDGATFGDIGPTTDVYATGVMLYNVLAGKSPFSGTLTEVYTGHLTKKPPTLALGPALSAPVNAIIERAMAKKPQDRFQSAKEMGDAVRTALALAESDNADDARTLVAGAPITVANDGQTVAFDNNKTIAAPLSTAGKAAVNQTQIYTTGARAPGRKPWIAVAAVIGVLVLGGAGYFVWQSEFQTKSVSGNAQTNIRNAQSGPGAGNPGAAGNAASKSSSAPPPVQTATAPAASPGNAAVNKSSSGSALEEVLKQRSEHDTSTSGQNVALDPGAATGAGQQNTSTAPAHKPRPIKKRHHVNSGTNGWIVINKEDRRLDQ